MADERSRRNTEVIDKPEQETKQPTLFRVILHNDDYTTMEFVVEVLEHVFLMHPAQAYRVMLQVHNQGRGVCGVYPRDIAATKVEQVCSYSRQHQHPLQCVMEEA